MEPVDLGDSGKEQAVTALSTVARNLEMLVRDLEVPDPEKHFIVEHVNQVQADITNGAAGRGNMGFSLWGSLSIEGLYPVEELRGHPFAAIKDLRIPRELRNQGWARRIVEEWERSLGQLGIDTLAAFNIQQGSLGFWERLGYKRSDSDTKEVPWCMVKLIDSIKST